MLADALRRFRALQRNARLYLISNTIQAVSAGALTVLYTLFLSSLGYSTTFIGLLVIIGTLGGGLGIIPASGLARRLGWRGLLLWSDLIGGVAIAAQLLLPIAPVIVVTTLGVGASVALFLVVNAPFLAANSTPRERTALFGLNNALGFLAAVTGSILGGLLPAWFSQRAIAHSGVLVALQPLLVAGGTARTYQLALLVTGILAAPSILPVLAMRDEHVTAAATTDSLSPASPLEKQRAPRARLGDWLASARTLARGVIGKFSVTQALVGFGAGLFYPYLSLFFVNHLHTSTAYFGTLNAALTVVLALASLVAAPLADRFGKMRTAVVAQACSVPFLLALGLTPLVWLVSAALLLRGFLMNITAPPLQTYLMEAVPERSRVVASGVYNVSFQLVGALGSGLGGWLIAVAGYQLPIFVAAPFYIVSALLLVRWFGLRDRAPLPSSDSLPASTP